MLRINQTNRIVQTPPHRADLSCLLVCTDHTSCSNAPQLNDQPSVDEFKFIHPVTITPFLPHHCCLSPRRWGGLGWAACGQPICPDLPLSRSQSGSETCNQNQCKKVLTAYDTEYRLAVCFWDAAEQMSLPASTICDLSLQVKTIG